MFPVNQFCGEKLPSSVDDCDAKMYQYRSFPRNPGPIIQLWRGKVAVCIYPFEGLVRNSAGDARSRILVQDPDLLTNLQ